MPRKVTSKDTFKERTIENMQKLGVYKPEYDMIIDIYSDLQAQYVRAQEEFAESNYEYETPTAAGGTKKSAIVATLETLRKDILAYSDRLCLNPKALETVTPDNPKKSKLSEALKGLQ